MSVLLFITGVFLGVPLGWAVLFCLTLRDLRPREPKTKDEWKLDVMLEALEYLGNPQNEMDKADDKKVIHIAGTNGKGSTASYIRTILEEAGYKVGCFTSPHLVEYNERFYFRKKTL